MRPSRATLVVAALLIAGGAVDGVTASNVVPTTSIGTDAVARTIPQLAPAACAALDLTSLVTGTGTFSGTAANELILGSAVADVVTGGGGDDCIVGGSGIDSLVGGLGSDVCIATDPLTTFACEVTLLL